jgi:hypothetical protein
MGQPLSSAELGVKLGLNFEGAVSESVENQETS